MKENNNDELQFIVNKYKEGHMDSIRRGMSFWIYLDYQQEYPTGGGLQLHALR